MCNSELRLLVAESGPDISYTSVELEENFTTHLLKTVLDFWIIEILAVQIEENMVVAICICQMHQYRRVNYSILGGEVLLLLLK